jgi:F-type H+-transporting ATPase subunit gamma
MQRVLSSVASRVDPSVHPLLQSRESGPDSRTLLNVVTGEKGLAGSFNTNVIKGAGNYVVDSSQRVALGLVGRKGRDFFVRRGFEVMFERIGVFPALKFQDAQDVARAAIEAYTSGQVDRVMLAYNEFRSVMSQRVVIVQLLPIARAEVEGAPNPPLTAPVPEGESPVEYLYSPSPQEIFDQLLPRYIEVQVYRALLESNAAFFAAQMTAMDTATKNSAEMIATLTLYMNKVRQAAITREIIEVVSGAQAL